MITLHKFGPALGLPDISPFCIKVETYLRMAGVPFRAAVMDVRKAPKQKLPCVDDDGTIVCDSRDIIAHFEAKIPNPLDAALTARERSIATAFRGLVEEEMYFHGLYLRWQLDENFAGYAPVLREYLASNGVPGLLAPLVVRMVRKQVIRALFGQGTGRHTREQVEARACAALDALAQQLGEGPYFLGDRPRTIDATVFAFVWTTLEAPFESRARRHAQTLGNLVAYSARMRDAYFAATASGAPQAGPRPELAGSSA
jgi:glutathione S-transferase